jgi:Tfp pilus assembly protein PilE
MDQLQREIVQITEYLGELRAERVAAKEKEAREAWTRQAGVSVVVVAVLAAIATQWGGKYTTRTLTALNDATFLQAKASDQWAFYQAKSIKQTMYAATADSRDDAAATAQRQNVARYEQEKNEIKAQATAFEAQRDKARADAANWSRKGGGLGIAIAVFQIGIAIASVSMITKKKGLWVVALALGAAATAQMAYSWLI